MGRYIVTYGLPLLVVLPIAYWMAKQFWLRVVPKIVEGWKEVGNATAKYTKALTPKTVKRKEDPMKAVHKEHIRKRPFFRRTNRGGSI